MCLYRKVQEVYIIEHSVEREIDRRCSPKIKKGSTRSRAEPKGQKLKIKGLIDNQI